jgi:hypothetical protein
MELLHAYSVNILLYYNLISYHVKLHALIFIIKIIIPELVSSALSLTVGYVKSTFMDVMSVGTSKA